MAFRMSLGANSCEEDLQVANKAIERKLTRDRRNGLSQLTDSNASKLD